MVYLDLLFSSESQVIVNIATDPLLLNNLHHIAYTFEFEIQKVVENDIKFYYNLISNIGNVHGDLYLNSKDINQVTNDFY